MQLRGFGGSADNFQTASGKLDGTRSASSYIHGCRQPLTSQLVYWPDVAGADIPDCDSLSVVDVSASADDVSGRLPVPASEFRFPVSCCGSSTSVIRTYVSWVIIWLYLTQADRPTISCGLAKSTAVPIMSSVDRSNERIGNTRFVGNALQQFTETTEK